MTEYLGAGARQFGFMVRGLRLMQPKLEALNIPLFLLKGKSQRGGCKDQPLQAERRCGATACAANLPVSPFSPAEPPHARPIAHINNSSSASPPFSGDPLDTVPALVKDTGASLLVTDFAPLRLGRAWREGVAEKLEVPFHEVDAHNVVPCWVASGGWVGCVCWGCVWWVAGGRVVGGWVDSAPAPLLSPTLPAAGSACASRVPGSGGPGGGLRARSARRPLSQPVPTPPLHPAPHTHSRADKREYAARTIRPKIHAKLPEFLTEFPELTAQVGAMGALHASVLGLLRRCCSSAEAAAGCCQHSCGSRLATTTKAWAVCTPCCPPAAAGPPSARVQPSQQVTAVSAPTPPPFPAA